MPLNIISNFAANRALTNLTFSSMEATKSVGKLSSGSRVFTSADDIAAMAIGSRLRTEVAALDTAVINARQASSLLQIADGTLARVQDLVTRLKQLAVQAGSQNLGDFERGLLDIEFQNLLEEIDRISFETEFNGKELFRHQNVTVGDTIYTAPAGLFSIDAQASNGSVINFAMYDFDNVQTDQGGDGSYSFSMALADSSSPPTGNASGAIGESGDFLFQITAQNERGGNATFSAELDNNLLINPSDAAVELATGVTLRFDLLGVDNTNNFSDKTLDSAGFMLSLNDTFNIAAAASSLTGTFTDSFQIDSVDPQGNPDLLQEQGPTTDFTFKVGSGILPNEDQISVEFGGVSTVNLGLGRGSFNSVFIPLDNQGTVDIRSAARADAASQAVTFALDRVTEIRADVGGAMSRLEVAIQNVTTTIENTEAARSTLLDLDVAREITNFTSKQILVQAGISVLAQANQLPQNLLRLFA